MEIRSAEQAAAWLDGLINLERRTDWPYARLGLGPIRKLLVRLGDPQRGLGIVHIAGSKGKGSTALLCEALFRSAGLSVGTFVSPHLERWSERIRLDGDEVDEVRLVAAIEAVRPHVEALRAERPEDAPTFFDAVTAAALVCFRDAGVAHAVLEVGLGGRLDSTNAQRPRVTCITGIELEHTDQLGDTLAAIAGEKAGILASGVPAVVAALPEEARAVVAARAAALGVPASWFGKDFGAEVLGEDPLRVRLYDGDFGCEAELPLLGTHHAGNAALALACVRRAGFDDARLAAAAPAAFAAARLPGRVEVLRREPLVIVDSAHTAASARALAAALAPLARRTHLVLSISAGKALDEILGALLPLADAVTLTRAVPSRSLAPSEVAAAVRRLAPACRHAVVPNPHLALRAALEGLDPDDCLCVAGSVYLAGIARRVLGAS